MTSKLRWSLVQSIRVWGWDRTLGLFMAALAALLYLAAQHYTASPLMDLQSRLATVQRTRPAPVGAEPQITTLKDLPSVSKALINLAELQNLASARGLALNSGQYNMDQEAGLVQYRLNLPLKGSYPSMRMFLSQALARYPNLALDNIRISRDEIGKNEVNAVLLLSLYFKP
jgi:hypothetical protein